MNNATLDKLIKSGTLESYSYDIVNEEGQIGFRGQNRNTEKLHLIFPDGNTLTIDTFCSGYAEDSGLQMETNVRNDYHTLTIYANSKFTKIYVSDPDENLVVKQAGILKESLLAGNYNVRFNLHGEPRLIKLTQDTIICE